MTSHYTRQEVKSLKNRQNMNVDSFPETYTAYTDDFGCLHAFPKQSVDSNDKCSLFFALSTFATVCISTV